MGDSDHRTDEPQAVVSRFWFVRRRFPIFVAFLTVAAIGAHYAVAMLTPVEPALELPWLVLLLFYVAVEFRTVLFHFRREVQGFSLTEVPLVVGLFTATPLEVVGAAVLGTLIALVAKKSQRNVKLLVNVLLYWISTCLGVLVFRALSPGGVLPTSDHWFAAGAAAFTANFVSVGVVLIAIRLTEDRIDRARLVASQVASTLGAATSTAVGLMVAVFLSVERLGVFLLIGPLVAIDLTLRAYTAQRDRTERLDFLYRSTQTLQRHASPEDALLDLLQLARDTFRGRSAEVVLTPAGSRAEARRLTLMPDLDDGLLAITELDRHDRELISLLHQHGTILSTRDREPEIQRFLAGRGFSEFVAAPLEGESRSFGYVVVADRRSEVSPLTEEEERLFGTLAAQVSVWLENSRLERTLDEVTVLQSKLSHQAYHDSLTGLPNRASFNERLETETQRELPVPHALLFIDVDGFKGVNDTLGHEAGDELLSAIAGRLSTDLRDNDLAARLGGDEFAIILRGVTLETAETAAERIAERIAEPFDILGNEVEVKISVGVALGPADTPSTWLRHADQAMYRAKKDPTSMVALHDPAIDEEPELHPVRHPVGAMVERRNR